MDTPSWAQTSSPDVPSWAGSSAAPSGPNAVPAWAQAQPAPQQQPQPKSSWSNIGRGLQGAYSEAVTNGLLMEPVRWAMEHSGYGMDRLKSMFPGQSDQWYQSKLHDLYNQAVVSARQNATQEVNNNPYPGHQIGNTIAAIAGSADPTWFIAPGASLEKGVFKGGVRAAVPKVAAHVERQAARMAVVGSAADDAAQLMDMAEGVQKNYDVERNLKSAAMAGAFGGVHAAGAAALGHPGVQGAIADAPIPDFVKNLFIQRGVDTTPQADPLARTSPLTGERVQLSPEEQAQFKQLVKTGTVDQIKQFFQGKNGPQPTWAQINQLVEMRDNIPEGTIGGDNLRQAIDEHLDTQHRQLVSDHIDALTSDWKNKPDVEVVNKVDDIQDPKVRQEALNDGVDHTNTVGFVGSDGKVRVFAGQVKSPEAVNAVLYHEALGHYGLAQQFGAGLDKVLTSLTERNVGGFGKEVADWQKANPGAYGGNKLRAAEEVLAEKSQAGPLAKSWGDAVVAHLRRFGRRMGLNLSYSDAEINHILSMAHDAVINGKTDAASNRFAAPKATQDRGTSQWLNFADNESDTGNRFKTATKTGEQLGREADEAMRNAKWGETARDRLIKAQRVLSQYGGDHPEARQIADEAADELGYPRIEHATVDTERPELIGDSVFDNRPIKPGEEFQGHSPAELEQAGVIKNIRANNKLMTPNQLNRSIADGSYQVKQMEYAYHATDRDYVPTERSWDDVRQEALQSGFSPSQIKAMGNGPDISKRLFRIQAAAKVLDNRISGILEKFDTPEWSEGHKDELRQALVDHAYILSKLRDERAETARALNMSKLGYTRDQMQTFGEILRESGGTLSPLGDDETLNRFARTLKGLVGGHNPAGLNSAVSSLSKPNWEDYLTTLHQNMMLSGLSTHVKAPLDMMIGIGRDLLDNATALPMSAGREALRSIGINVKPGVHPTEVAARLWGILRAGLDAHTYQSTASTFINGGYNPNGFGGKQNARIPVVSKVTDLISAQDAFFRAFATNMHLYGLGTRQALEEARANGTSKDWDTIMTQGANYARNPSVKLLNDAKAAADENLLLNKNKFTEPLDKLKRTGPDSSFLQRAGAFVANFLTPFVRVESNSLMNRVIRRSPLAFFDQKTINDLKAGGIHADVAMSRIIMGTAAIASYWMAAGQGKTTGEGPDNPAKKAVLEAAGWRPNAVHENGQYNTGNKLGISLNPFDVHNATASMVADLREAYEKGANQGQVGNGLKLAVLSSIKSLTDMSWVSDIAPAVNALTAPNTSMEQKVAQFAGDQASTMVPNLFGQAARVSDQGQPMTYTPGSISDTVRNSVMANIPGLREQLPKRMDVYGEPVQSGATMFGQHTWLLQNNRSVAGNHVDETTDVAKQEVTRLSELYQENLISPIQRNISVNGQKMKLTNDQMSEYQHMAGQEILARLHEEMSSPEWSTMSDEDKAEWIRDMQKSAKADVRGYLYGE